MKHLKKKSADRVYRSKEFFDRGEVKKQKMSAIKPLTDIFQKRHEETVDIHKEESLCNCALWGDCNRFNVPLLLCDVHIWNCCVFNLKKDDFLAV